MQRFIETTAHGMSRYTDPVTAGRQAYQLVGDLLGQQAALFAYVDTFRVLAVLCLLCVPLVLSLRKVRAHKGPMAAH